MSRLTPATPALGFAASIKTLDVANGVTPCDNLSQDGPSMRGPP
jgi:hypothetical protein